MQKAVPAIVHRDIKASNIMLGAAGRACLGDFGIARHHALMKREASNPRGSAIGHSDTLTGTFGYVAPDAAQSGAASIASERFTSECLIKGYELRKLHIRMPHRGVLIGNDFISAGLTSVCTQRPTISCDPGT